MLKVLGNNSGNLMFQYATTRILDGEMVHLGLSEVDYTDREALKGVEFVVFPAANHLRLGADWTGLNNFLAGTRRRLIIFGLGAQSPKIGGEAETIAALKADPHVRRMVDIFRDQAAFVSVRGEYSRQVCEALGLPDVRVLGCPSALLNPDPTIGRKMEARLKELAARDTPPRFGLTAAAPFEISGDPVKRDLERRLFSWLAGSDGVYVQQSGGQNAIDASNGRWFRISSQVRASIAAILAPDMDLNDFWAFMARAGRFYTSAPQWIHDNAKMEMFIGTRLHGNMAAIAAGTPGVIVAHDSRTDELANTMLLPRIGIAQVEAARDLHDALARIEFDGAAFDRWRASVARELIAALGALGIPVKPNIHDIAA
ncbi:polysaccharide pyruvyl transferase family protein [Pinisolibacter sp.]|uniref:polysaccharide pyruvyl transferase family protein n=1 Tax=Pinisolibacter sp. TaxID=2172024 RepID=UPI002FDCCC2A